MPAESPRNQPTGVLRQLSLAMELPFVLVAAVLVGGGAGYFLDRWLRTGPWLMLLLGVLGFAGGMRELLRRLNREEERENKNGGG
jgi:F0F1-type ATP synthase assembly protein I